MVNRTDIFLLLGVGVASYALYKYLQNKQVVDTFNNLSERNNAYSSTLQPFATMIREGDTTYAVTKKDIEDTTAFQKTLLNSGTSISTVSLFNPDNIRLIVSPLPTLITRWLKQ